MKGLHLTKMTIKLQLQNTAAVSKTNTSSQ